MSKVVDIKTRQPPRERARGKHKKRRCTGLKKNGEPCTSWARAGTDRCSAHPVDGLAVGRPTEFTEATQKAILEALGAGVWKKDAVAFAGVSMSAFTNWQAIGQKDLDEGRLDTVYARFVAAIHVVQAKHKTLLVGRITKASSRDWKAAAWMLERMFPNEFGKRDARLLELDMSEGLEELLAGKQPVQIPLDRRQRIAAILEEGEDEEVVDAEVVE